MTRRNIEMISKDSVPFDVTVYNGSSTVDVTGYFFRLTAKYAITDSDADAVFSITSPGNITLADPTNGLILVTIPPSATSALERGLTYYLQYDIQMSNDPSVVYTVCSGILTVLPDCSNTAP